MINYKINMNFLSSLKWILTVTLFSSTVSLSIAKAAVSQPDNNILDTTILDQEFTGAGNLAAFINEGFAFTGQVYTAGLTGTLAGVSIDVQNSLIDSDDPDNAFPLRIAIHEVSAGLPTSNILGETILDSNNASLDEFIGFSQTIPQVIERLFVNKTLSKLLLIID